MQRLRRLSISSSTPDGVAPPPGSGALHRSATGTALSSQQRAPLSPSSAYDAPLRRTPSSHLLSSLNGHAPATTAVCSGALAQATVVRAPSLPEAGARPRLTAYAAPRSSSRTRAREHPPPPQTSAPIPISPTSPSAHAHRRESALAAAIRTGDAGALRAERRRTEMLDSRLVHASAGAGAGDDGSEEGSGESYEVEIVDTRGGASGGLVRAASGSSRASGGTVGRNGAGGNGGLAKPLPRFATGRRLSCLATYEGLPIPPQLRGGHSVGGSSVHEPEPELNYSLHGLRLGASGGAPERPRVRRLSSSAPPPQQAMHRPPSPAPEAFKSSVSPLTRSTSGAPRRPSSPGPGMGTGVRRASSPAGPRPSGLVAAAPSPGSGGGSAFGSVRRAPSPSPGGGNGLRGSSLAAHSSTVSSSPRPSHARAPSPARGPGGTPRIVHGFDAPARPPSPSRSSSASPLTRHGTYPSSHAPSAGRHASSHGHSHSSPSLPYSPSPPSSHATTTRPRSRLADARADEHLEVLASRDFAVIDEYYSSRRGRERRGERREVKREAEERLRRGYDRSLEGGAGR
ncbi:hypothetical protein JCM10449v2_002821 [Rhodotorula kratochvilovae]